MRKAELTRNTNETNICIELNIDGTGKYDIDTGLPFLNHMLELFTKHSMFDLKLKAKGDLEIDAHHTIEDIGIVFGKTLSKALAEKKGIIRYGHAYLPMDETLVRVVVDLSGRPFLVYNVKTDVPHVGGIPIRLFNEFFQALTNNAMMNLHIELLYGAENHHIIEAVFKGFAKAMMQAVNINPAIKGTLSTKGTL